MMLKLKAYNCDATPNKIEIMRSSIYRLVNIIGDDGKIIYIAGGYPKKLWDTYLEEQIDKLNLSLDAEILVVNDIALELVNQLIIKGFHNFVIAATDSTLLQKVNNSVNIVYYYDKEIINIETTLVENLETMNRNFDLIISNPPFAVGNQITKNIIDNINFSEFLNLMPISKYSSNNLFNYVKGYYGTYKWWELSEQSEGIQVCLTQLSKNKANNYTQTEFEQLYVYDQTKLKKFWKKQNETNPTFIKHQPICLGNSNQDVNSKTWFVCNRFTADVTHGAGPRKIRNKDNSFRIDDPTYIWNFIRPDNSLNEVFKDKNGKGILRVLIFNSEQEKINFTNWFYSAELNNKPRLSGLISILLEGLNKPGDFSFDDAIPHVDWNRPWTDEEILRDYGYTDEEIKEILYEA